jgi:arylsulfatase A-like enzyme
MLYNMNPGAQGRDTLVDRVHLIGHYLREGGYRLGYSGKWHIDKYGPHGHGFEGTGCPSFGLPGQFVAEYDGFLRRNGVAGMEAVRVRDYLTGSGRIDTHLPTSFGYDGILDVDASLTPAGFVASTAIELMEEMRDEPFFLTTSFWGPHHPALPTEEFASLYDPVDIPEWPSFGEDLSRRPRIQARYARDLHRNLNGFAWSDWAKIVARHYAHTTMIDAQIARIMEYLRGAGLDEKTIVIFSSDHGDTLGCHGGQFDKGPYAYQETYAVPMVVRGPGVASGTASAGPVSNLDLFSTILDLAGVKPPEQTHAVSFAPQLGDPTIAVRDAVVAEFNGFDLRGQYMQRVLWNGRHKYVFPPGDFDELYDLEHDPHELTNLIDEPSAQDLRHDLAAKLVAEMRRTADPFARHAATFVGV